MKITNAVKDFVSGIYNGIAKIFNRIVECFTGKSEPKAQKALKDIATIVGKDESKTIRQRKVINSEDISSKTSMHNLFKNEVSDQFIIDDKAHSQANERLLGLADLLGSEDPSMREGAMSELNEAILDQQKQIDSKTANTLVKSLTNFLKDSNPLSEWFIKQDNNKYDIQLSILKWIPTLVQSDLESSVLNALAYSLIEKAKRSGNGLSAKPMAEAMAAVVCKTTEPVDGKLVKEQVDYFISLLREHKELAQIQKGYNFLTKFVSDEQYEQMGYEMQAWAARVRLGQPKEKKMEIEKRSVQEMINSINTLCLIAVSTPSHSADVNMDAELSHRIQHSLESIVSILANESPEVRLATLEALNIVITPKEKDVIDFDAIEGEETEFQTYNLTSTGAETLANALKNFLKRSNYNFLETQLAVFKIISSLVHSYSIHDVALNRLSSCLLDKAKSPSFKNADTAALITKTLCDVIQNTEKLDPEIIKLGVTYFNSIKHQEQDTAKQVCMSLYTQASSYQKWRLEQVFPEEFKARQNEIENI